MTQPNIIFIPGNVPSLKNSKQWIPPRISKYGKKIPGRLISSKTVQRYLKVYNILWQGHRINFSKIVKKNDLKLPYHVGFHFVRNTRHKYDWINACQIVQDLMVQHGWIEDDNIEFLFPHPFEIDGKYTSYNKNNPGVWIKIINVK